MKRSVWMSMLVVAAVVGSLCGQDVVPVQVPEEVPSVADAAGLSLFAARPQPDKHPAGNKANMTYLILNRNAIAKAVKDVLAKRNGMGATVKISPVEARLILAYGHKPLCDPAAFGCTSLADYWTRYGSWVNAVDTMNAEEWETCKESGFKLTSGLVLGPSSIFKGAVDREDWAVADAVDRTDVALGSRCVSGGLPAYQKWFSHHKYDVYADDAAGFKAFVAQEYGHFVDLLKPTEVQQTIVAYLRTQFEAAVLMAGP